MNQPPLFADKKRVTRTDGQIPQLLGSCHRSRRFKETRSTVGSSQSNAYPEHAGR
jgi:hypothetical protein